MEFATLTAAERMRRTRARRRGDPDAPPPRRPGPAPRRKEPVRTVAGTNATMIAAAASLYIADGAVVADVTWGKGLFWRKAGPGRFRLAGSDISGHGLPRLRADFRQLPYADGSVDVVVLDPPYLTYGGSHESAARYGLSHTRNMNHDGIMAMYRDGMTESRRVLRRGGQLWVKCKDQVGNHVQYWSHIELHATAAALGFSAKDLFVLVASGPVDYDRWPSQHHARKTHSFLWIFTRP